MEKVRVAAYCRVSTETEMQTNSFESQKAYFEEYIKSKPEYEFYNIYADYGISGTETKHRDNFNRMINDAQKGRFDLILTKEVSRFARNVLDSIEYTRRLKEYNVGVLFTNDNINTLDSDGELRLTIMSILAQDESRKISERVKWGMRRGMEQGKVYTSPLIGYDLEDGKLIVNTEEAEIVREIFHLYAYKQMGANTIARYLTERAIRPPKRIKTWSGTTITRILKNEKYVGDLVQGKTVVKDFLSHKSVPVKEDDRVAISNHHEAIVDRETWNTVQGIISDVAAEQALISKTSNTYWCSGKIKCGHCGKYYTIHSKKKKSGLMYVAWRCIKSVKNGCLKTNNLGEEIGCNNKQINFVALNECVKYAFQSIAVDAEEIKEELINKIYEMNQKLNAESKNGAMLDKKFKDNSSRQEKLYELYYDNLIDKDEFAEKKKILDEEKERIEFSIREMEETVESEQERLSKVQIIIDRINEIIDRKEYNDDVYGKLVEQIVVYDNLLIIYFKNINVPVEVRYQTMGRGRNYEVKCSLEK